MPEESSHSGPYYYAGGEKIELTPAEDLVAVKNQVLQALEGVASTVGRALTDGLRLVAKHDLGHALKELGGPKSEFPVFRSHGGIVVALPEVRVEEGRKTHQARLEKWLTAHGDDVQVVSRGGDCMVLKPVSGSGQDALAIANDLAEQVGPEMAQARFIRVTPRPHK